MKANRLILLLAILLLNAQCKEKVGPANQNEKETSVENQENTHLSILKKEFGTTDTGEQVDAYTLKNSTGMEMTVITYGGIITQLKVPDKNNRIEDVVLGYDSLVQYTRNNPYFGALIGRYGNRIKDGKFSLDGTMYTLEKNDGPNHLHGGKKGFDKVVWKAEEFEEAAAVGLKLSYTSADMEEGYPGTLTTTVTYTLTDTNSLDVRYEAKSDRKTIVNLTQHSYFNLTGDFSKPILDHEIKINANQFIPVDESLIPTGELAEVNQTPFDFRSPKKIGADIDQTNDQLKKGRGYDHCWVLNEQNQGMRFAASAYDSNSGRYLEIFTDEPGIQFYTGNFLDGSLPAKGGGVYGHRTGFCLETQHYPDAPNQPNFPSVELSPGETYHSRTSFKFSTK